MIKNIIFDLGNVLINFKPKEFLLEYTQDKERIENFFSKIIWSETWWSLDRGTLKLKEAKKYFDTKYPEEKDLLQPYFEHWLEILTPIPENIEIVRKLKENGYKVFVLSNFIKEAFEYVTLKYDFFSFFDGMVISSDEKVKLIKPEKEIYKLLLNRYNLNPVECVFIDDHEFALEPAKEMGIHVIWANPNISLSEELRNLGLKI